MNKHIHSISTLLFALILLGQSSTAQQLSGDQARQIAIQWLSTNREKAPGGPQGTPALQVEDIIMGKNQIPAIHVFNVEGNRGFVLVSAEAGPNPILAYSDSGTWSQTGEKPPALLELLDFYTDQINQIRAAGPTQKKGGPDTSPPREKQTNKTLTTTIGPLIYTLWGQGCYYNEECPIPDPPCFGPDQCGHADAGCVPVAMAQLINYYQSSPFYTFPMPATLTATDPNVAGLIADCGYFALATYSCNGTGAYNSNARNALVNHFGLNSNLLFVEKEDYSNDEWEKWINNEIASDRPVIYSGWNNVPEPDNTFAGHTFILDGLSNVGSDGLYHMYHVNWGWNGQFNGFFSINGLAPAGTSFFWSQWHNMLATCLSSIPDEINMTPLDCAGENKVVQLSYHGGFKNPLATLNWYSGGCQSTLLSHQEQCTTTLTGAGPWTFAVEFEGCGTTVCLTETFTPLEAEITGCLGDSPDIHVEIEGGFPPYHISIQGASNSQLLTTEETSLTFPNLLPGTYTIKVTDHGCGSVEKTLSTLVPTTTVTNACNGLTNGKIAISTQGGVKPFDIYLNNISTGDSVFTNLAPGTYGFTIVDATGCLVVAVDQVGSYDVSCSPVASPGGNDEGTWVYVNSNGVQPLTYKWSNGKTTPTIWGNRGNNYGVTVTDSNGCKAFSYLHINCALSVEILATGTVPTFGSPDINLTAQISCGDDDDEDPECSWHDCSNHLPPNPPSGDYCCTVRYSSGATATACTHFLHIRVYIPKDPNELIGPEGYLDEQWVKRSEPMPYIVNFENDPEFATATAQRVTITLPFTWNQDPLSFRLGNFGFAGQTFEVPENSPIYSARLDLRDSLGVFVDVTAGIDVAGNRAFWIFQSINPETGLPPTDPTQGLLPVNDLTHRGEGFAEFRCTPRQTSTTGDSIPASAAIVFDINEPVLTNTWTNRIDALPPTTTIDTILSTTIPDELEIHLAGSDDPGGCGIHKYELYVSANNETFRLFRESSEPIMLFRGPAGFAYSFFAIGTDGVGNRETMKVNPEATAIIGMILHADPVPVQCNGMSNGGIDLTVQGGVSPLLFEWSNGQTNQNLAQVPGGSYQVTVTDLTGRTVTGAWFVDEPQALSLASGLANPICYDESNGSIQTFPTGGVPPYSFVWSSGESSQNTENLPAGVFTLSLTDHRQCTLQLTFTLTQPEQLTISAQVNQISCPGCENAGITVTPTGGTPPFTFIWSDEATIQNRTNLGPGTFQLTVSDSHDCQTVSTYTIILPDCMTLNLLQGWNLYSLNVNPFHPEIEDLLGPVSGSVILVKDENGALFWPSFGINSIQTWQLERGYLLLCNQTETLPICGYPLEPENTPILVREGWNLLAYLRHDPAPITSMFAQTVSNLTMVKDGFGFVYWPLFGVNTIGQMVPGRGYQAKAASIFNLVYPPNAQSFGKANFNTLWTSHFSAPRNTGHNMVLGIPGDQISLSAYAGLNTQSGNTSGNLKRNQGKDNPEIAVFTKEGLLVGSSLLSDGMTAITIWGDDELTPEKEGLEAGERFFIRLYDPNGEGQNEWALEVETWIEGDNHFETNQISIAGKLFQAGLHPGKTLLFQNTPNPFRHETSISFVIPERTTVNLTVYSILGERIETLVAGELNPGKHDITFTPDYPAGSYFYQLRTPTYIGTRPMKILKE